MKISVEEVNKNKEIINEVKTRWQKHEKNMNIKSPLEYLDEIKATTEASFEIGTFPSNSAFDREIYKTGDGDTMQAARPGAMDHKKYKSKIS